MIQAFELEVSSEGASLAHADWLGLLADREITHRRNKRVAADCAMPGCATTPLSKTSAIKPPPGPESVITFYRIR